MMHRRQNPRHETKPRRPRIAHSRRTAEERLAQHHRARAAADERGPGAPGLDESVAHGCVAEGAQEVAGVAAVDVDQVGRAHSLDERGIGGARSVYDHRLVRLDAEGAKVAHTVVAGACRVRAAVGLSGGKHRDGEARSSEGLDERASPRTHRSPNSSPPPRRANRAYLFRSSFDSTSVAAHRCCSVHPTATV
ncbi:MAG: hypothetical protein WKH64_03395 [Chloroflexia bacterium]